MSKYIDLAPTIKRDRAKGPITGLDGESYALTWLDSHPDQVPGRTITESEFEDVFVRTQPVDTVREKLSALGITVIPDPVPKSEADKLIDLMVRIDPNGILNQVEILKAMAEHGVKAPGGDDE